VSLELRSLFLRFFHTTRSWMAYAWHWYPRLSI